MSNAGIGSKEGDDAPCEAKDQRIRLKITADKAVRRLIRLGSNSSAVNFRHRGDNYQRVVAVGRPSPSQESLKTCWRSRGRFAAPEVAKRD